MAQEVFSLIEVAYGRPSGVEFELAYHARIAVDCIRFAIKATEDTSRSAEYLQEARLQLLEALDRLEAADQSFRRRFRQGRMAAANGDNEIRVERDRAEASGFPERSAQ